MPTQAQAQASAQSPGGWERLSAWWPRQPLWVAAALLLPLLAYLLMGRLVIPRSPGRGAKDLVR
ncbi:MAG: hypothetical protein LXA50_23305, partial [Betaproteobacteria bacterium]|nr:hypothetical protein [Betaproteobacteria bacterium]